jgi:NADP-dependent aldehyde dehydrogenase
MLVANMQAQPAQTMLNTGALASYIQGINELHEHPGLTHLAGKSQVGDQAQPQLFMAEVGLLLKDDALLQEEVFGPTTVVIEVEDNTQLEAALQGLRGQLTATLIAEADELLEYRWLADSLQQKVGRILVNGYPTGVEVCEAMVHGGPYPATSDPRSTSVGSLSIDRFLRPICFQNYPDSLLPEALQNSNPLGILRLVDGDVSRTALPVDAIQTR